MKILNRGIVALVIGIMVFSGASLCPLAQAETTKDCEKITNAEFTGMLVDIIGIEMPEDADSLSDAELFEVQSNMLADRGIAIFLDKDADTLVTCGMVADVLYGALIDLPAATTEEKITQLVELGYISAQAPDDVMCSSEVIAALNIPELTEAIAESYSAPGEAGVEPVAGRGRAPAPANPSPEGPASPV